MDPTGRACPRDQHRQADHARAHAIEHARLGGEDLCARARHLADAGRVIDPGTLAQAARTTAGTPAGAAA
jgi:hypothetical protein